jgi:hypothetical protein
MMRLRLWHRNVLYRLIGFYSFSFLAPLYSPRPFAAPPGEKEEPTATFGHVFKAKKYSLEMHVDIISSPTAALLSTVSTAGGGRIQIQIQNSISIRIQSTNFNNLVAVQRASARVLPSFIDAAK